MTKRIIEEGRLKRLLEAEDMLDALQAAGVDNWSGYSDALDMVEEGEVDGAPDPLADFPLLEE